MLAWVLGLVSLISFAYDYHRLSVRRILTGLLFTFIAGNASLANVT
jgi:hypothetical protein